jgi:hypothetical protein
MPWRCLGERRYSSHSFLTSALDRLNGQSHALATLYSQRKDRLPATDWPVSSVDLRAGLDAEARENPLPPSGTEPWFFESVFRHYTD